MTTTNVSAKQLVVLGGGTNEGYKIGLITSKTYDVQNDTWTVKNAEQVIWAWPTVDSTGAQLTHTLATNVITITSATTGDCSALVIYR